MTTRETQRLTERAEADIAHNEAVARGQTVLQLYRNAIAEGGRKNQTLPEIASVFVQRFIQLGYSIDEAAAAWRYTFHQRVRSKERDILLKAMMDFDPDYFQRFITVALGRVPREAMLRRIAHLTPPTTAMRPGFRFTPEERKALRREIRPVQRTTEKRPMLGVLRRGLPGPRIRRQMTDIGGPEPVVIPLAERPEDTMIDIGAESMGIPLADGPEQTMDIDIGTQPIFRTSVPKRRRRLLLDRQLQESVEEAAGFVEDEEMEEPAPFAMEGELQLPPLPIEEFIGEFPQPIPIADLLPPLEVVVPEQSPLPEATVKIEPDLPPSIPPRDLPEIPAIPPRPSDAEQQYITTITNMTHTINTLRNQAVNAQQVSQVCENRVSQLQDEKRDLEVNMATLQKQFDLCMLEKTVAEQKAEREQQRRIEKEQWANNALSRASTSGSDKEAQCEQEIRSLQVQITDKNKTIEDMQQSSIDRQKTIGDLSSALQLSQDKIKSLQKDLDDEKAKRRSKMGPQPTFDACCEKLSDKIKDVIEKLDSLVQTKLEENFYESQFEEGEERLLEDRLKRLRGEPSLFPEVPTALAGNGAPMGGTGNCLTTPHFNRYTTALERWAQSVNEMLKDIKKEVKKIEKKEDKECPPTFSAEDVQKIMAKLAFLRSTLIEQGIRSGPVSDAVGEVVDAFSDARFSRLQGAGSRPVTAVEVEALLQQYQPPAPVIEQQQNCVTPADLSQAVNNILNAFAGVIINQQPPPSAIGLGGPMFSEVVPKKCTVVANGLMNALCRINGIRPKLIAAAKECDPVAYQQFLNQRKAERKPYVRNCDLIRFIYGVNPACVRKLAVEAGIFQNKKEIEFE